MYIWDVIQIIFVLIDYVFCKHAKCFWHCVCQNENLNTFIFYFASHKKNLCCCLLCTGGFCINFLVSVDNILCKYVHMYNDN